MDRLITIEVNTPTQSASGAEVASWSELAKVWAVKAELGGAEGMVAAEREGTADVEFRIYHRTDVSVQNRISYDGNLYDIVHVGEIGRREGLAIKCKLRAL